ncbi:hypothetical protein BJP37_07090 [Moorena bouillonii PNG]|uniref:Uncharacterized protein n=1 Tax=Moorena bouillonii PNG TaxID=568701 RepID=A0A1U7MYT1_9CYAN|nr:hypothetical protein BJP37_07090 [Moorena bouillonii PNG]
MYYEPTPSWWVHYKKNVNIQPSAISYQLTGARAARGRISKTSRDFQAAVLAPPSLFTISR